MANRRYSYISITIINDTYIHIIFIHSYNIKSYDSINTILYIIIFSSLTQHVFTTPPPKHTR